MEGDANGVAVVKKLGQSLPVENVQALAAASKDLKGIPERYIRPELEVEPVLDGAKDSEIPVLDMRRLLDPHHSQDEISKLRFACEEWGFFQIVNHGVAGEVMEKIKVDMKEFFQLPLEEKKAYAQLAGTVEGYGQAFVVSEDQKLDWGDMFFLATHPVGLRNMRLWPTQPPTFRATLDRYSSEVKRVTNSLLQLMERNLGLNQDKLTEMFKDGLDSVRMNYYPPCRDANKVIGLSPHSDTVGLTILLQASEVQGLQIKKNGGWIPVKPLPGAFIVNIGDILEVLTNGKYKSIEHRAVVNPENERLSIAAFHSLNYHAHIGPLPELVEGGKERYKTLTTENYIKLVFASKLDGKSHLDLMKK